MDVKSSSFELINTLCYHAVYIFSVLSTFIVQLLSTADEVEKLQEELETMQPLLAQAAEETVETMEKIKVDSVRTVCKGAL